MQPRMSEDGRPVWDSEMASRIVGKLILVGITYQRDGDGPPEQVQYFGRVESADPKAGIALLLEGKRSGERSVLPPDTRGISAAAPGEYSLRSTGEIVTDPDYVVSYTGRRGQPS